MEKTAILQPIGFNDKGKQLELASGKPSKTWTLLSSSPPLINQIMAYKNITKLEKFSGEKDNTYLWIAEAKKVITTKNWNDDRAIQLRSNILQSVRPRHPTNLQEAVTLARDFESAEQKVNHTQAINLAINEASDIDTKITQLSEKLTQKIERFLARTAETYQLPQRKENNNSRKYPQH
ncbi:hypothetical protein G9A89_001339 [Geosiphon pyriformis]|nr:hypothetical protein G9A89_001339 [Geosiphon pyriformis]